MRLREYLEVELAGKWWNIGTYRFPEYIRDNLSLKDLYKRAIVQNTTSPYQLALENYFEGLKTNGRHAKKYVDSGVLEYHKEFPFLIRNRELWKRCLEKYDAGNYEDTHYFLGDNFFYKLGLNVEQDSGYHLKKKAYDQARDLYLLQEYGVKTIRVYHFSENDSEEIKKFKSEFLGEVNSGLKKRNAQYLGRDFDFPIDNMEYCVNLWKENHKVVYDILSWIEECNPLSIEDNLVSKSMLERKFDITLDEMFCDILSGYHELIYGKKLKVVE